MDLTCPHCHKYTFKPWQLVTSRMGRREYPKICPKCGEMYILDKKQGNIINLISFVAFFGFIAICMPLMIGHHHDALKIPFAFAGVAVLYAVRIMAIQKYGKLESFKYVTDPEDEYPHIKLDQVAGELEWLKKAKTFVVLFGPDDSGYLSVYYRNEGYVIDLSFASAKLEKLKHKFTEALGNVGAKPRPFGGKRLTGIEADLGGDLSEASGKVQKIMRDVFHLAEGDEIGVMRER